MARRMRIDERTDAVLVAAALGGERQAVADIYDRYSTVIFTVCVRLIGNRDEAADCAADVFLRATERLHQLRDPEKLKPWLYAIARNEVARRQRQRGREVLVEAIDDLPWIPDQDAEPSFGGGGSPAGPASTPDPTAALGVAGIERLLLEASAGLTDRDRAVAELGLRQNLQGDELAEALGVTTNHAYVLVHRVRGRLEKAITAILVARSGRDDCVELAAILAGWDGDLTVLLRKRVARHIDRCDTCGARRKLVPAALFDAAPVLAAPIAMRQKVLADARVATETGRPWSRSGFPRGAGGQRRGLWVTAALAILVVVALLGVLTVGRDDDATLLADRASVGAIATTAVPGTGPAGTTSTALTAPGPTSVVAPVEGAPADDPAATSSTTASTTVVTGPKPVDPPVGQPIDDPVPLPPTPGFVILNPSSIDFGPNDTTQVLSLANAGGTAVAYSLTSSSPKVSLSSSSGSIGPFGSQVLTVVLDRSGLPDAFTATLSGQLGPDAAAIPVMASNNLPPTITSVTGPHQFGAVTSANPGCNVDVVATDNTAVLDVRVVFDNPSTAKPDDWSTVLPKVGTDHWRGQLLIAPPPSAPLTGTWHVEVRDVAGQPSYWTGSTATTGSLCIP